MTIAPAYIGFPQKVVKDSTLWGGIPRLHVLISLCYIAGMVSLERIICFAEVCSVRNGGRGFHSL